MTDETRRDVLTRLVRRLDLHVSSMWQPGPSEGLLYNLHTAVALWALWLGSERK